MEILLHLCKSIIFLIDLKTASESCFKTLKLKMFKIKDK